MIRQESDDHNSAFLLLSVRTAIARHNIVPFTLCLVADMTLLEQDGQMPSLDSKYSRP